MAGPEEDHLGRRLAEGQPDAFATLYDCYGPRLYRAACVLLDNRHDAEDAVQGVFLSLLSNRRTLAKVENWAAYLFTSLRNEATRLGAQRRRRHPYRPTDELDVVAAVVDESARDDAVNLEKALVRLPAEQRQVIRLKTDAGLTFAHIGELLGISPNTAASRYRYAVDKLRNQLKEPGDES
jgi:RNA polymerase sigma-70 factor (ECF subfamily)